MRRGLCWPQPIVMAPGDNPGDNIVISKANGAVTYAEVCKGDWPYAQLMLLPSG